MDISTSSAVPTRVSPDHQASETLTGSAGVSAQAGAEATGSARSLRTRPKRNFVEEAGFTSRAKGRGGRGAAKGVQVQKPARAAALVTAALTQPAAVCQPAPKSTLVYMSYHVRAVPKPKEARKRPTHSSRLPAASSARSTPSTSQVAGQLRRRIRSSCWDSTSKKRMQHD
jgi:hypothetical protein